MTLFGLDCAYRTVDFLAAARAGMKFAIAEATINRWVRSAYAPNIAAIRAAGLVPGAYHFLYPVNGRAQCDLFLDTIGDPEGLLCAVDIEKDGDYRPKLADLADFVTRWRERVDHPLFIYLPRWYWDAMAFSGTVAAYGPLWWSYYHGTSTDVATRYLQAGGDGSSIWDAGYGGWTTTTIWQFTGTTVVPTVGSCDLDAFAGSLAELQAYTKGGPMLGIVTRTPFPAGPRIWRVAAGTVLPAYDPRQPGKVVKTLTWTTASSARATAEVAVSWPGTTPAPSPSGGPFLEVLDGSYAGLLIVKAQVKLDDPPPAPVDPHLAQIAALTTQVTNLTDSLTAATTRLSSAKTKAQEITQL